MPGSWVYREDDDPRDRPPHPPTQAVRPQPGRWQPEQYSQTRHLQQLHGRPLPEPPRPSRPQPSFNPQYQPAPPPAYPQQQPARPAFQPGYNSQPDSRGYYPPPPPQQQPYEPPRPRRKRRVFLWVFLAVQAVFIIWMIAGLASHPAGPTAAQQAAQQCANHGWYPLFKSQADCNQHYAVALNDAGNVGKGIGAALIVIFWIVTDFFLGLGYLIYKLASRR
jgi:hypothetical protein